MRKLLVAVTSVLAITVSTGTAVGAPLPCPEIFATNNTAIITDPDDPRLQDKLEKLPGVGRKTANVVLNVAFGEPTIAVDTHIFRVSNRTGLAPGKNPLEVELKLEKSTPEPFVTHAHHWLILHGRYICKARTPECWHCPVVDLCAFKPKTRAPKAKPSAAPVVR